MKRIIATFISVAIVISLFAAPAMAMGMEYETFSAYGYSFKVPKGWAIEEIAQEGGVTYYFSQGESIESSNANLACVIAEGNYKDYNDSMLELAYSLMLVSMLNSTPTKLDYRIGGRLGCQWSGDFTLNSGMKTVVNGFLFASDNAMFSFLYINTSQTNANNYAVMSIIVDSFRKTTAQPETKSTQIPDLTFDLSVLTIEDLAHLRDLCQAEMMKRNDWKEVLVPVGLWKVGVDIPEGHYSITAWKDGGAVGATFITYFDKLDASGKNASWDSEIMYSANVRSKYRDDIADMVPETTIDIDAKAGMYILIDGYDAMFTPYTGKPSLQFD